MAKHKSPEEIDDVENSRMGLGDHLTELRTRLIRSVAVMVVAFLVLYGYRDPVFETVQEPQQRAMDMLRGEYGNRLQSNFQARIDRGEDAAAGTVLGEEVRQSFKDGWPESWELREGVGPTMELTNFQADGG
ncbi:MAG: twin-arginine translocase subunit TatC, partial [Planctomycetes bacterium]|nr:twin-arginine translocase subunit TatC [Planctomycetota bacterium]